MDTCREPITVLLVEDNAAHAELVTRCLSQSRRNVEVRHVWDGELALDYLLRRGQFSEPQSSPMPRVVLLDLRLPKLGGIEVLKTIKSRSDLRHVPVIVLTTSLAERDVARAYRHHANSYLVKPADFEGFQDMMNRFRNFWLQWNHPRLGGRELAPE